MNKLISVFLLSSSLNVMAEVAVVVHPSSTVTLDQDEIAKIYLGKTKSFANGNKIDIASLGDGDPITSEFNEKVLKKSSSQVNAYWSKLVFTGKGTPPQKVDNSAAMINFVASTENAIGFIDANKVTDGVKVIAKF
ncbi:phosphate ABC transporter substrate-binding protein [Pseudoalteromonas tunicata]|jgi:ABC-type phosphate transport system substrate-binding protein|uniref:ABC-type phosphate transport system, periplasmic component n=1 Tax=Pseudoalteromonas tunicata D2 TaxID=87626 RepID=A4CD81_9GAMM|nr:phosphate ABC transporter substrate-binding protein [Pseudoalteromonas tunicata]ATC94030.1 hypothetical protein PTUN_a1394 [Pseudoalteromonas tunicata]AXT29813.1 phosphate ABC transporter substrate-binding protein [Pseudoalteromonas tunicata]EAR27524.1 ABC-type phosphate transport system, periplasmic component [Pseudoalteromonas tunicata D2]